MRPRQCAGRIGIYPRICARVIGARHLASTCRMPGETLAEAQSQAVVRAHGSDGGDAFEGVVIDADSQRRSIRSRNKSQCLLGHPTHQGRRVGDLAQGIVQGDIHRCALQGAFGPLLPAERH